MCKSAPGGISTVTFLLVPQATWEGVIHHICDVHEWVSGVCEHTDLTERDGQNKRPIERGSFAFRLVGDILLDRRFLTSLRYYTRARYIFELYLYTMVL